MDFRPTIFALLACFQVAYGQTVTVTGPTAVERGSTTELRCTRTDGLSTPAFLWRDETANPVVIIFIGENSNTNAPKYTNFDAVVNGAVSTMTISNTEIEDEGRYGCSVDVVGDDITLSVEVAHTYSLVVADPLVEGNMYNATCDAMNGRPDVTITWELGDNTSPCNSIDEQTLTAPVNLTSKRSVCTLLPDRTNNGDELRCIISGHQVSSLNGQESSTLNIQYAPVSTDIMTVDFQVQDSNLLITCNIADNDQPNPRITNYYIIANDTTVVHQSTTEDKDVLIAEPTSVTDFRCVAGNGLGNTTAMATYDPTRTTTPPTPTEPSTPEGFITVTPNPAVQTTVSSPMAGDGNDTSKLSGDKGLGAGAIAGIAIGAILAIVIIIIVIVFFLKKGSGGSSSSGVSAKKHTSSTVGTSNGSEKEKIKPVAAPRDQGSIQHTTDNPGQAEYAMVDRKKSGGGDMPDTRGPSHDSPGMHYADLDLSTNAGHTERQVPQNPDNVVVYSSILV